MGEQALENLANKHHFENLQVVCDQERTDIQDRFQEWHSKLAIIQSKVQDASTRSEADAKSRLKDATRVFDDFWKSGRQSESNIRNDIARLLDCVSDGNSLFHRMATHLQSVPDIGGRTGSMFGLIKKSLATLAQADATYMARLMYTQYHERNAPDMKSVAISMTDVMIRRGKLFKAFWY